MYIHTSMFIYKYHSFCSLLSLSFSFVLFLFFLFSSCLPFVSTYLRYGLHILDSVFPYLALLALIVQGLPTIHCRIIICMRHAMFHCRCSPHHCVQDLILHSMLHIYQHPHTISLSNGVSFIHAGRVGYADYYPLEGHSLAPEEDLKRDNIVNGYKSIVYSRLKNEFESLDWRKLASQRYGTILTPTNIVCMSIRHSHLRV